MKKIEYTDLEDNFFETIGKEWMLVTAGTLGHHNMMTASWGGIGWLWNKPVAFIFIRPERYTFQLTEAEDNITLSFLGHEADARAIYNLCGSKSGRDTDKTAATGLQPVEMENGGVGYEQSRLTLTCRKLYADNLRPEAFADASLAERWYGEKAGGFHRMYVLEIKGIWTNE